MRRTVPITVNLYAASRRPAPVRWREMRLIGARQVRLKALPRFPIVLHRPAGDLPRAHWYADERHVSDAATGRRFGRGMDDAGALFDASCTIGKRGLPVARAVFLWARTVSAGALSHRRPSRWRYRSR